MEPERIVNYAGALEHIRKSGADLGMSDLANLTMEALQARVRRGTIKPAARRNKRIPLFKVSYLDQWIRGELPEQQAEAA